MELSPLFYIVALLAIGNKLTHIFVSIKEKNKEKLRANIFFLFLMILIGMATYFIVQYLRALK
jgi:hypothetical protein